MEVLTNLRPRRLTRPQVKETGVYTTFTHDQEVDALPPRHRAANKFASDLVDKSKIFYQLSRPASPAPAAINMK